MNLRTTSWLPLPIRNIRPIVRMLVLIAAEPERWKDFQRRATLCDECEEIDELSYGIDYCELHNDEFETLVGK